MKKNTVLQTEQSDLSELDQEMRINNIAKRMFKICQLEKLTMSEYNSVIKRVSRMARTSARM